MKNLPRLTVICPVYNEEVTVPLFFERIRAVFKQIQGKYETHLLFMDNASSDRTHEIIKKLCATEQNTYTVVLSRNFGYQCSVECGLRTAQSDLFIVIDVDCEDPPELITDFLKYYEEGYDVVYGERADREENLIIKTGRKLFYRVTRAMADDYFILDMAEFCLITSEVRDAIMEDSNSFPFIRASIGRVGFRRKGIVFKRHRRIAGKTHYNFWRMGIFAVAGILSSSTLLLRMPAYVFPFWVVTTFSLAIASFATPYRWCLPLMAALGFTFLGFSVVCIGIYQARIYKNGLNRPNYVIDKKRTIWQPAKA